MDDTFEGAFFATCNRPRSWFRLGAKKDKAGGGAHSVDALFQSYHAVLEQEKSLSPEGPLARLSRAPEGALSPRQAAQTKVQKYTLGADEQCALAVLPGASAIAAHLVRVLPYVHSDGAYLLCFCGCLTNLPELVDRTGARARAGGSGADAGELTTCAVLALYNNAVRGGGENSLELLLSELHGRYAFFLYDRARKQSFAARDPSGEQQLYFCVGADDAGGISFTNTLERLPEEQRGLRWRELPPGHYVYGSKHQVQQFALTPQELEGRRRDDSLEMSLASGDDHDVTAAGAGADGEAGFAQHTAGVHRLIAAALSLSRKGSLD